MIEWGHIVDTALRVEKTPVFVFSRPHVEQAVRELDQASKTVEGLPIRHWLSFKTQPLPELVHSWCQSDRGVEVVSEYELLAVRAEGLDVDRILVNGVAKHSWLEGRSQPGLRIHFDSLREVKSLSDRASKEKWRVGLRVHVSQEHDPDEPKFGGQFGLTGEECGQAYEHLRRVGVDVESLHFHLRSNVESPAAYGEAIREIHALCVRIKMRPRYLDCGGGIPVPGERTLENREREFDLTRFFEVIQGECQGLNFLEEIWLENGRYVTSRAGVLVLTVLDRKDRKEGRYLICDGGRTNHALVSDWGVNSVTVHPHRNGKVVGLTTICGPTCMVYDRLCRLGLPEDVEVGDRIVWHNAGAYHLPWETRFSHGLAPVVWYEAGGHARVVRYRENFAHWWGALRSDVH